MLLMNWLTRLQKVLRPKKRRRARRLREQSFPVNTEIESLEKRMVLNGQPIVSISWATPRWLGAPQAAVISLRPPAH